VTASAGNHGQALALSARELGATATIFVPGNAPETKKARIRSYGATLDETSPTYDDAELAAIAFANETGRTFVHAYSDRDVVAGQGTVGLEILEDLPDATTIVVPVGGGGLIAGIGIFAKTANSSIRVVGVQSTHTSAMFDAFAAERVVESAVPPTIADGLAGQVDQISFERARAVVDEMILVEESAIPHSIRELFVVDGIVAEGAAATAVAAVCDGVVKPTGPTVLVITGGNIDAERFAAILTSA
jgi:threonine dehydratase